MVVGSGFTLLGPMRLGIITTPRLTKKHHQFTSNIPRPSNQAVILAQFQDFVMNCNWLKTAYIRGVRAAYYLIFHVLLLLLLLLLRYNSGRVLAFSTISFHLRRSWTCSAHFISFVFLRSFLMSSHGDLGLPTGLIVNGFHLYIFLTVLVSDILFMCPNQLTLWALT